MVTQFPQTLSKILYCETQYTQLMIHSLVKHCSSLVSENSCLVLSVRLGAATIILAQYATDRQISRVSFDVTYSPGWLQHS